VKVPSADSLSAWKRDIQPSNRLTKEQTMPNDLPLTPLGCPHAIVTYAAAQLTRAIFD